MTAAMNLRRRREPAPAGVVAPPESLRAPIWQRPVPGVGRAPLVWLLGVHGGSGATTLAHVLAPAADARGRWPGVFDRESPYVVLVARETISGLTRAHDLLRQHHAGFAGATEVLGLITVAARPGRVPPEIRRYRDVVGSLAGHVWQVPWFEEWTLVESDVLPVWSPGDGVAARKRRMDPLDEVPVEIGELGVELVAAIRASIEGPGTGEDRP
ncbi:hypothetical protein BOX37_19540 [Nocardia mangyaensis]|uniref:Uncharacterized protein n=1 Tax=Nocardia mangyaensis TaxID=2213200 RepID=A0A1J0VUU3_9NOCA|nr:hypothetical protein [Nocardia mangyaensis]APE35778.1 hypothetical protein BOX37_19540 [Nocardia mangyaensis]MDO3646670.1 hypothetical protein [Nocardia mangyaensis]